MKLFVIFAQRKQSYDGEYAPEALDCIDEFGNDENPDFLKEKLAEYEKSGDFSSIKVVAMTYDASAIDRILNVTPEARVSRVEEVE